MKYETEAENLTFTPNINKPQTARGKMTNSRAANFWERSCAFVTERDKKLEKMDLKHNKDLTFQPVILPKSR